MKNCRTHTVSFSRGARCFMFLFVAGLIATQAVSDPKKPVDPTVPDSTVKETKDANSTEKKDAFIQAAVVTAGGDKRSGVLIVKFNSLEIDIFENGSIQKKTVPLSSIASIEFIRWKGRKIRGDQYIFYPSVMKFIQTDKTILECRRHLPLLDAFSFKDTKGAHAIYTYFYDYRINNKWRHSGQEDLAYPETNPHPDAVMNIIFNHTKEADPLEWLRLFK